MKAVVLAGLVIELLFVPPFEHKALEGWGTRAALTSFENNSLDARHATVPERTAMPCNAVKFSGKVVRGQTFTQPLGNHLVFRLRAIASGWRIEVVADNAPPASHDLAELATPPYLSPTPLLVSTDYSFRSQDAAGWTPRSFRFLTSAGAQPKLSALLDRIAADPKNSAKPAQSLLEATQAAAAGQLDIVSVALVRGNADISGNAAAVGSHLRFLDGQEDAGPASPLGRLDKIGFTVTLNLDPAKFHAPGLAPVHEHCAE